jgi:biopolymer transport protein ExbD
MAMSVGSSGRADDVMVEMNTTPLIDVLLVLLVMLIITIPIQTHAVKLDMPRPNQTPPPVPPPVVNIGVDFDGTVTWNDSPIPDRATLDNYLRIEAAKPKEEQSELHIRPDRLAKYGQVAVVLADAQRIGVTKIGFVGNEQYME